MLMPIMLNCDAQFAAGLGEGADTLTPNFKLFTQ
jgi:hypothetical protein